MDLYPSILVDIYQEFEKRIRLIENAASFLHIDVGDGKFVPHKSFQDIEKMKTFGYSKPFELHLMIANPKETIEPWLNTPAKRLIVHWEAFDNKEDLNEVIERIKEQSKEAGLAINPPTPVDNIVSFFSALDLVLIMGYEPGYSGTPFMPEVIKKITQLKERGFKGIIEIDGGMNKETLIFAKNAGANAAALASAIFNNPDPLGAFCDLKALVS